MDIQFDSLEAIQAICGGNPKTSQSALVRRIHHILAQENSWPVWYVPGEENRRADFIAKLAFGREEDLNLVEIPSKEVVDFIRADKAKNFCNPQPFHVT